MTVYNISITIINMFQKIMSINSFTKSIIKNLFITLAVVVFVNPNISFAQTWQEPECAPPNCNAPAPIHEGTTGQGKYWGSAIQSSSQTIGAFLMLTEGLLSRWTVADGAGVAAKQFCLMYSDESLDYFPGNIQQGTEEGFLKCIDWSDGWGSLGTDGGGGGPGGTDPGPGTGPGTGPGSGSGATLQNGQVDGNVLVWRADTGTWVSAPGFRQASFLGNGYYSFVMGDWPDTLFSSIFGTSDASVGSAFGKFALNGGFYYRPDATNDGGGDTYPTAGKILGGDFNENYKVKWFTPSELGLVSNQDITTIVNNISSLLPNGTITGQMLFWQNNGWNLTDGILGAGDTLSIFDGLFTIGTGTQFTFFQNENCPVGSDGSVLNAEDASFGGLFQGLFNIKCNGTLRIKDTYGDGQEEVLITNVAALDEDTFNNSSVRGLCYVADEDGGVEKGTVVDCEQKSSGELFLPGPRFKLVGQFNTPSFTELDPTSPVEPIDGLLEVGSLTSDKQYQYTFTVPLNVQSVLVQACAGGGGGGGGGAGLPGNSNKAGGGGGGGGAAGECTSETINTENVSKLVFKPGAGGRAGYGGKLPGGLGNERCATCTDNNHGVAGTDTTVQVFDTNDSVIDSFTLAGGNPGIGGYKKGEYMPMVGAVNTGGVGGKSGATPDASASYEVHEEFLPYNGQRGNDNQENWLQNPLGSVGYLTTEATGNSFGGNGGRGLVANASFLPSGSVYQGSQQGNPGSGVTIPYVGNGYSLWGGSGNGGTWASGGGGGGGASGAEWSGSCLFYMYGYPSSGNACTGFIGDDVLAQFGIGGGFDYGSTNANDWFSQGGGGGRGGPGFVKVSW